jgi:hypothetical protein
MQHGDHAMDEDPPAPTMNCTDGAGGSFYLLSFNDEERLSRESSSFGQLLMKRIIDREEPVSLRSSCLEALIQLWEEAPEPQIMWRATDPRIWQAFWLACMEEKQLSSGLYTAVAMAPHQDALYMLMRPCPNGDLGLRAVLHYTSFVSPQQGVAALACLAVYADLANELYALGWTEILSRLIARPLLDNADVPNHTTKLLALLCIERAIEHDAIDYDGVLFALIELLKHVKPEISERACDLVRAVLRKGCSLSVSIGTEPQHIDRAFKGLDHVQFDASRGGSHSRQSIIHAIYAILEEDSLPDALTWVVQRTDVVSAICSVLILGPIEARLYAETCTRLLVERCSLDPSLSPHFESLVAPLLPQLFGSLHFYLSELNTGTILKMISCSDVLKREAIDFGGYGILEKCIRKTRSDDKQQGRLIMIREILSECLCVEEEAKQGYPQLSKLCRPPVFHPARALRPVLRLSNTIWCKHKTLRPLADFFDFLTDCPASIASSTPPYGLVYVNAAFCELTRYGIHECIGFNCRFLRRPNGLQHGPASAAPTEARKLLGMADAMRAKQCFQVELTNFRSDGVPFQNFVTLLAVRTADGTLHYIGVQFDMDDYRARHRHLNNIERVVDFLQNSSATSADPWLYGERPNPLLDPQSLLHSHRPEESTRIPIIHEEDESQEEEEDMVRVESHQKRPVDERCIDRTRREEINQSQAEHAACRECSEEWWNLQRRHSHPRHARTSASRSDAGSIYKVALSRLHSRGNTATDAAEFQPWRADLPGMVEGSWDWVLSQSDGKRSSAQPAPSLQPPDGAATLDDLNNDQVDGVPCPAPPRLRPRAGKSSTQESIRLPTLGEEQGVILTPVAIHKLRL